MKPYYKEDGITIYCGDCRDVLPTLPKVDLVLTDPPYGVTACDWDMVVDPVVLWPLLTDRMTAHGSVVMTARQPFTTHMIAAKLNAFRYCLTWVKNRPSNYLNADKQPMTAHEDILVFGDGKSFFEPQKTNGHVPTNSTKGSQPSSVYSHVNKRDYKGGETSRFPISVLYFDCERGLHPTQKPVPLMSYLLKSYAADSSIVLDPFGGSGTTAVAAKQLGRKAIIIEKEENHCAIAVQRLRQGVLAL